MWVYAGEKYTCWRICLVSMFTGNWPSCRFEWDSCDLEANLRSQSRIVPDNLPEITILFVWGAGFAQGDSWVSTVAVASGPCGGGWAYNSQCCQNEQYICTSCHIQLRGVSETQGCNCFVNRMLHLTTFLIILFVLFSHFLQKVKAGNQRKHSYVDFARTPNLRNTLIVAVFLW